MRHVGPWSLVGTLSLVACGTETDLPSSSGGSAGMPTATSGAPSSGGSASGGSASGGTTSGGSASGGTTSGAAGSGTSGSADGGTSSVGGGGTASGGSSGGPAAGGGGMSGAGQGGGGTAGQAGGGAGGGDGGPMLPKRVLLHHFSTLSIASVPAQLTLLKSQLQTWGYEVEDSVDPATLSATNLQRFGAVGMINTCFEPFGAGKMGTTEAAALKEFVEAGGGLFGTHCASVTFQSAQPPHPYNVLIGGRGGSGYFDGKSACRTLEQHPSTTELPATFDYTGNLDNTDYVAPDTKVVVKCVWSGGDKKDAAVSWSRTPGKGRVFYTNFAKEDKDLKDATLGAKHILAGLSWVLGR